ncbi:hypothetical protein J500_2150 [Acinetobacter sp. 479375]|nr:hypothetical protein J500_2150 [Acinetobacter sp. 479375]
MFCVLLCKKAGEVIFLQHFLLKKYKSDQRICQFFSKKNTLFEIAY